MTTQADAVTWLLARIGRHDDFDGQAGDQCVDEFNFYYQAMTADNPYTDGYEVPNAKDLWSVPNARFIKIPDSPTLMPQPGDVAVYGAMWGAGRGHVEMCVAVDKNGAWFVGENEHGNPNEGVVKVYRTWAQMKGLIGVMRFRWSVAPVVAAPAPAASTGRIARKGTATVAIGPLNVRTDASTSAAVVAQYAVGQTFNYDSFIITNGYVWLSYISNSGARHYVAEGPNDGNVANVWVKGGI